MKRPVQLVATVERVERNASLHLRTDLVDVNGDHWSATLNSRLRIGQKTLIHLEASDSIWGIVLGGPAIRRKKDPDN